jgi:hypothetical protein
MMWLAVSLPLWFVGLLLFVAGVYAVVRASLNETDIPTFKFGDDGDAIITGLALALLSAPLLYIAAKLVS